MKLTSVTESAREPRERCFFNQKVAVMSSVAVPHKKFLATFPSFQQGTLTVAPQVLENISYKGTTFLSAMTSSKQTREYHPSSPSQC